MHILPSGRTLFEPVEVLALKHPQHVPPKRDTPDASHAHDEGSAMQQAGALQQRNQGGRLGPKLSRLLHHRQAAWWFALLAVAGVTHFVSFFVILFLMARHIDLDKWLFPCFRGSRGRLHTCVPGLIASAGSRAREGVGWQVWAARSGARAGAGGRSSAAAVCSAGRQRTSWPRRSSRSRRGPRPGCCATTTTSSSTSCTMH